MTPEQLSGDKSREEGKTPPAPTGNASNPSAEGPGSDLGGPEQLLDPKAEKYLREVASIEDLPDEQDWQDAEETIKKEKEEGA